MPADRDASGNLLHHHPGEQGLHLSKTADASVANPGDTVAYTVVVSNTGNAAFGSGSLPDASFSDSLSGVHADTTFVPGSAKDTTGNVTYSSATGISWSGPLPVGGSATVTYRVLVDQPDSGPHTLTNSVVSGDPGNNCATGSTDPACSTRTLVTGLAITIQVCGSESAAAGGPGGSGPWSDSVVIPSGGTAYWRIVVTNNGAAPLNGITLGDPSAPSCQSAAGTFALGVGQTLNVYCTTADVTGPISNTATATHPSPNRRSTGVGVGDHTEGERNGHGRLDAGHGHLPSFPPPAPRLPVSGAPGIVRARSRRYGCSSASPWWWWQWWLSPLWARSLPPPAGVGPRPRRRRRSPLSRVAMWWRRPRCPPSRRRRCWRPFRARLPATTGPAAPQIGTVAGTWYGRPLVSPVLTEQDGFLQVRLAQRPNGSTAWIKASAVTLD